jgi:hypothetical protein
MINNQEKNSMVSQSHDVLDLGTDDTPEIIDLSDMEAAAEELSDEIIDLSDLEKEEIDKFDIDDPGDIADAGILDLTAALRVDTTAADTTVADDTGYCEPVQVPMDDDEEEDFEIDLAKMIEAEEEMKLSDVIETEEFSLDEFIEEDERVDESGKGESFPEDELLEKLDDYFGTEDGDDEFDIARGPVSGEPADINLNQFEAALERVIEKKFGGKIDQVINELASRKISNEIDALKTIIVNSIKNR